LDRRLFFDAENSRLGGRIDIKPDYIGGFRHERRVVALASRLASGQVDIVLADRGLEPGGANGTPAADYALTTTVCPYDGRGTISLIS
jgi:hypothetical protein